MDKQFVKASKESFKRYMEEVAVTEEKLQIANRKKKLDAYENSCKDYYGEDCKNPLQEKEDVEYIEGMRALSRKIAQCKEGESY